MVLLIKNTTLNNQKTDILIDSNKIAKIQPSITTPADEIIEGNNTIAFPGFYNTHTHVAMTLLRGYSDDLPVMQWLEEKIWPFEAKLTEEDVYIGTKLGCLEMIKTGTVFFNDMYWHFDGVVKAVTEMGLRTAVNTVVIDFNDPENFKNQIQQIEKEYEKSKSFPNTIQYVIAAHSIYSVSEFALKWIADFAVKNDIQLHIHLSETEKEVTDCLSQHNLRPVEYLEKIGFLEPRLLAAHCIWLDDNEIDILKNTTSPLPIYPRPI